ncbi:hypothetical protein ABZ565_04950 [Streptomyces sp. NPDC016469]|uniref:hypothetical protein n=1 Tax=Streptomyces sp. NPDC016469 TaxID=3157191 RepID=UPI0033E52A7C
MNTRTQAKPAALWAPAPPTAAVRPGVAVATALLGAATAVSVAWLTFLVWMISVWGAASGVAAGGIPATYAACLAGGAALLTALAFAPPVRRMAPPRRALLLCAVACPVPFTLAVATWVGVG